MGGSGTDPAPAPTTPRRPRARDIGIVIGNALQPGPLNAITDVPRVEVGTAEKFLGDDASTDPSARNKFVRSGVTIIHVDGLQGGALAAPVFAGVGVLQGSGELTGSTFITESGQLTDDIAITGTMQVGAVHHGMQNHNPAVLKLPIVAETYDRMTAPLAPNQAGPEYVEEAFSNLTNGKIKEGNVGGGASMVSFGLKGGTGTSSRLVPSRSADRGPYTVGALIQANHGSPADLTIAGVPVGLTLAKEGYMDPWFPTYQEGKNIPQLKDGDGSIIVVLATDAPLLPHQCSAVARRAGVGISRGGGGTGFFSGDIFLCFSTARPVTDPVPPLYESRIEPVSTYTVEAVNNETLDAIFRAAADATEEAVLNALFAAEEMEGYTGRRWRALPVERVKELLKDAGKI
uniref:Aminopeptidase n=1 Tax=Mycena chlorophos TaxID=658473 RepID=A0ABQ0L5K4_MYCCL|nr:predicted protein [Mycena chlorophos]